MEKIISLKYEDIVRAIKRKDSLDILNIIISNYKRYFYSDDDIDNLLDDVSFDLIGFVDLNMLYKIHGVYKVSNCVISLKTIIDKLIDYELSDIDFVNVIFKDIADDEVIFRIIQ